MPTIDDLHLAMGVFLTESSEAENLMLNIFISCHEHRPIGESYNEFSDATFGGKILKFKEVCDRYPFRDEQRALLSEVYLQLDALLPIRNYIVHGKTYQRDQGEPFRLGKKRGDVLSLGRAWMNDLPGENVFTTARVAEATKEFADVCDKLVVVSDEFMKKWAGRG